MIKHLDFILIDLVILEFSFWLVTVLYADMRDLHFAPIMLQRQRIILATCFILVVLSEKTYHRILRRTWWEELINVFTLSATILVLDVFIIYFLHEGGNVSRALVILTMAMFLFLGMCGRVIWKRVLRRRYLKNDAIKENVMIALCSRARAEKTIENVQGDLYAKFKVVGLFLIDYDPEVDEGAVYGDVPVLGGCEDALEYATHNWVDEVLMNLRHHLDLQASLEGHFEKMGITTHHVMMKPAEEEGTNFQSIEMCGRYVVATYKLREVSTMQWFLKRTLDIIGGIVGLIITGIIYIFIAPQIKKADPGPVFYASNRVGRNGRVFKMYKFRSMYQDADARKAELMSQNKMQGFMFKMDDDPRIIGSEKKDKDGNPKGIGNFIRKTSLDEFPQFLNVLKGDMSLVGTRPPTLDEWEHYSENHRIRLSMRPGITGMWQATGRSDITDFEEVVRLDEEYIQNWTFGMDIKLLLMTVLAVLKHEGAE